jgi:hypothetical protein
MYKLVLFLLAAVAVMTLQALQLDREAAVHTLFHTKQALNRAAHAGAQQLDPVRLAEGVYAIDAAAAERRARAYLQANLNLDASLQPLPGAYLESPVEWLVFEVINDDRSFPYLYEHDAYGFRAVLNRPGVVMMVRIEYPRTYAVFPPISWVVKSAAELTVP